MKSVLLKFPPKIKKPRQTFKKIMKSVLLKFPPKIKNLAKPLKNHEICFAQNSPKIKKTLPHL